MTDNLNKIILKPRFKLELESQKEKVLHIFSKNLNSDTCDYSYKISGNHIFIDVSKQEEHFWSPQLHLEVVASDKGSLLRGLFAPKPNIWTFFMFLHVIVAVCFMVFFVIAYSKWSIDVDYGFALGMCLTMVILWFVLYFSGQIGKVKAKDQMNELRVFITNALKELKTDDKD